MATMVQIAGVVPVWTVSDRVRKAREYAGMDQTELASAVGMSRGGIARIEQGKGEPRRTTLIAVAFATGVSLEWLETGKTPAGGDHDGGNSNEDVRHQGLEPRTHWFRALTLLPGGMAA